jgi:5-methylcytosine-specific restriction endonuclease McrA
MTHRKFRIKPPATQQVHATALPNFNNRKFGSLELLASKRINFRNFPFWKTYPVKTIYLNVLL